MIFSHNIKIILITNKNIALEDYFDSNYSILGLALNMCILLAEKCDLTVVRSNTDEETAKLFKSMRGSNNFMLGNNKLFMNQAISMKEGSSSELNQLLLTGICIDQ